RTIIFIWRDKERADSGSSKIYNPSPQNLLCNNAIKLHHVNNDVRIDHKPFLNSIHYLHITDSPHLLHYKNFRLLKNNHPYYAMAYVLSLNLQTKLNAIA